jgi:tetratricopeptide (TPR) repeat protein
MRKVDVYGLPGLTLCTVLLLLSARTLAAPPMERMDYWQKNYPELQPADDQRVERAHDIFASVLRAAGTRPGVVPRLYIIKADPLGVALPIAIPDGGIILSQRVLDICYRDPALGDHRLAFLVAHEIAHLLKDDFWYMKLFQGLEAAQTIPPPHTKELAEILRLARATDDVWLKELQADEYGIVYASLAGFNTRAIVTQDDRVNFFADWIQALDPHRLSGAAADRTPPSPTQRAERVKKRLRQILDNVEVFHVGLRFYQAGKYARAILAFQHFLQFFPGREVYHNLATSHHQLALQYYSEWKKDHSAFPYQLALAVDPATRASQIFRRSPDRQSKSPAALFTEHLTKAIEYYQTALSLDPSYSLASNNLGSALLTRGDVYKAIGTLQDALTLVPDSPDILNNLGVAFLLAENPSKATAYLRQAHALASTSAAPLFNLGQLAYAAGREAEARHYWQAYLQLATAGPWAEAIRQKLPTLTPADPWPASPQSAAEHLGGVQVGHFDNEVPRAWGAPQEIRLSLEQEPFKIALYPTGVMTLSQDEEILLLSTLEAYQGTSARHVAAGSAAQDLLSRYGRPSQILHTTREESWIYEAHGIAFQLRKGHVTSWLLF